eukprot:CAMPEP_0117429946 /NCGR_PEP_ID=MMETSP0758-20121206/9480_1 /TAXON_ID=63605 /ORGANISM="Percolomonas cosmopolitus, Strain AE-1 (ATCC 50343)" /LENGTH=343 /DNA_ID=CAMNT_0005217463 /DNA_START=356 /DNA_END=1384 /DNA_ORIENTATION=+
MKTNDGEKLVEFSQEELNAALQYSATQGMPPLVKQIKGLQSHIHKPPYEDWDILVTTGSQSALYKAFVSLLNENDTILVENPTYSGALSGLNPLNLNVLSVHVDDKGIIPSELEKVLSKLKNPPKFLYTIPTGQNPAGVTTCEERKREIYELAMAYDFLILEDDPYYYLNFKNDSQNVKDNLTRSYMSIDHDQRVLRFDSFSKIISSGLRMGFVSGPKELITQLNLHQQACDLHASGLSQMCLASVFQNWGENYAGFFNHLHMVQSFYRQRGKVFCELIDKHLGDLVSYNKPVAGMFVWLKLNGFEDTSELIEEKAKDEGVLLVPGRSFDPHDTPSQYVRASY